MKSGVSREGPAQSGPCHPSPAPWREKALIGSAFPVPPPIRHGVPPPFYSKPQGQHQQQQSHHQHLSRAPGVTADLLKLIVGGARVAQEAVGNEDAARVILVASQVVAGGEVSGS